MKQKLRKLLRRQLKTICTGVLLMAFSLQTLKAQPDDHITLSLKNVSIVNAFKKIEAVTGLKFSFANENINPKKKITIEVKNASVTDMLNELSDKTDLNFKVIGEMVAVQVGAAKPKPVTEKAEVITVSGVVNDTKGIPLPGVSIVVKGTTNGTQTDANGKYSIAAKKGDILVFSFIGFKKKEVTVGQSSTVNIILEEDVSKLDQVVVTGYQTLRKNNTPGSYSVLNVNVIDKRPSISIERMLEGTLPGVSLYNGTIQIRGASSMRAGLDPLYVVDGFETSRLPENLNEVENITVLKDAAAAAVWGARAANGVVVITTKRGTSGKLKVSYNSNFYVTDKPDYDYLRRADASTLIDYEKEAYDKGYIIAPMFDGSASGYSQSYGLLADYDRQDITLEQRDAGLAKLAALSNKQQINDNLLRNGFRQNHYLSFAGGGEKYQFFMSGSYNGGHSQFAGDNNSSIALSSRNTYELAKFLKVRADINANFAKNDNAYTSLASDIYKLWPYQMLLNEDGSYIYDYSKFNQKENNRLKELGYFDNGINLLEETQLANNTTNRQGLISKVGLDVNILKGLAVSTDFQYERNNSSNRILTNQNSFTGRYDVNYMISEEAGKLIYNLPQGDRLDLLDQVGNNYSFKGQLNFNRNFNGTKHYVNAVLGSELRKNKMNTVSQRKLGYSDDLLSWQTIDAQKLASPGITWWDGRRHTYNAANYDIFREDERREVSFYSSAVYTYNERYTLSGSLRIDQSNLFGADPKYRRTPLWSVGASWDLSKEDFFKSSFITNLNLRATYGLMGNYDKSTTPYLVASRTFNNVVKDNVSAISSPPNPKLRWERTRNTNLGIDFGVLDGRYSLSVDVYKKFSYDLLGTIVLDPTVGFSSARINGADMVNKGVEVAFNANFIKSKDFSWNSILNFAYNKNEITNNRVSESDPALNRVTGTSQFVQGYARESLWSYKWAGLDDKGNPQIYGKDGQKVLVPETDALTYSGTSRPKYTGGWINQLRYKAVELSFMMVYNFGHVLRREIPTMNPWETTPQTNELIGQRWRKPGDELITDIPSIMDLDNFYDKRSYPTLYSSNSVINGGFVRFREIQLNFTLPKKLIGNTPLKILRVYGQVNNLGIITKNGYNIDPEASNPLTGVYNLPEPTTYTLGIKADF